MIYLVFETIALTIADLRNSPRALVENARYYYIPYVLNHGYNVQTTKSNENKESMVAHELARLTIPYDIDVTSSEFQRSGKALPDFGVEDAGNNFLATESYSYLDLNGRLKTTKDILSILTDGYKIQSYNRPKGLIASVVASKVHRQVSNETIKNSTNHQDTKTTGSTFQGKPLGVDLIEIYCS